MGRLLPSAAALLLSTPARLTLALSALYVFGTLLIFLFLNFQLHDVLVAQVDRALLEQKSRLLMQYKEGNSRALLGAIRAELNNRGQRDRTYRVFEQGVKVLEVGDLQLPTNLSQGKGISKIEVRVLSAEGKLVKARYLRFAIADQMKIRRHSMTGTPALRPRREIGRMA